MKKTVSVTVALVMLTAAAVLLAGATAQRTRATTDLCHSSTLSIKVSSTTVRVGVKVKVTGAESQKPDHSLNVTLQYRRASVSTWVNGASQQTATGWYSVSWKAPKRKGKYKVRVEAEHSQDGVSATQHSSVRTITVR